VVHETEVSIALIMAEIFVLLLCVHVPAGGAFEGSTGFDEGGSHFCHGWHDPSTGQPAPHSFHVPLFRLAMQAYMFL